MPNTAWSLLMKLQGDASGLIGAAASGEKALGGLASSTKKLGRGMESTGKGMTKAITLPIVAAGAFALKTAADFEKSMVESTAIMGDLSDDMKTKLEQQARDVALTTRFSAEEAAQSYFYLASAGLDASQSLEALPRVAKFAQAGNFDMARATDLLTDAQSALGMTIRDDVVKNMENMNRVSDVLVKANILANATVEQFSESLTNKAGSALKVLNKDVEEGVAVLAAFADQGVKGTEAGEKLNIVLRDLQTSNIKNRDAWDELGLSVYDANGDMNNMADIIGGLEGALAGLSDEQKRVTLMTLGFQDRSVSAIMTLLGSSEAIRGYEADLRSAGGVTDEIANKQIDNLNDQLKLFWHGIQDIGIELGQMLIPIMKDDVLPLLRDFAGWLKGVVSAFKALPDESRKNILMWAAIAAAMGPVLVIGGKILQTFGSIVGMVGGVIGGVGRIAGKGQGPAARIFAQPVFVTNWPPGMMAGGAGAGGAAAGGRSLLGTVAKFVLGPVAAIAIGSEIAKAINEQTIRPAIDFEEEQFTATLDSADADRLAAGIVAVESGIQGQGDVLGRIAMEASALPLIGGALGDAKVTLEQQRDAMYEQLREMGMSQDQIDRLIEATRSGAEGTATAVERAEIAARDAIPWAQRNAEATEQSTQDLLNGAERRHSAAEAARKRLEAGIGAVDERVGTIPTRIDGLNASEASRHALLLAADATKHTAWIGKQNESLAAVRAVGAKTDTVAARTGEVRASVSNLSSGIGGVARSVDRMHGTLSRKNFAPSVYVSAYFNGSQLGGATGAQIRGNVPVRLHEGTWDTGGRGGLAMLHDEELVLPKRDAKAFRSGDFWSKIGSAAPKGEENIHINVDGLIQAEKPSDLLRAGKLLAAGKRLRDPYTTERN